MRTAGSWIKRIGNLSRLSVRGLLFGGALAFTLGASAEPSVGYSHSYGSSSYHGYGAYPYVGRSMADRAHFWGWGSSVCVSEKCIEESVEESRRNMDEWCDKFPMICNSNNAAEAFNYAK